MHHESQPPSAQQQQQRRGSQHRRYLASLIGDSSSAAAEAPPSTAVAVGKPFSVSLSYTLPKRRTSRGAPSSAPPNSVGGGDVDPSPRSSSPAAVHHFPAPPPPPRRHSAAGGSGATSSTLAPIITRKAALQQREEDYDGSEASFIKLLMQKLRSQCDELAATGEDGGSAGDVQSARLSDAEQKEADRTMWSIVEARNRPSLVRRLPVEILISVFEFSGIADLCRLDAVSRRLHVVVSSPVLWLTHCRRYRLTVERTVASSSLRSGTNSGVDGGSGPAAPALFAANPKDVVRDYILLARRSLTDRLAEEQQTLENLERRLNDRVEHVAPFSTAFVEANSTDQPRLVRLLQHAEQQLTEMSRMVHAAEASRAELVAIAHANRSLLERQQVELHQWTRRALPQHAAGRCAAKTTATSEQGGGAVVATNSRSMSSGIIPASLLHVYSGGDGDGQERATQPAATAPTGNKHKARHDNIILNAKSIQDFERRVVRTVLSAAFELPLVIRRGTTTFGAMELLAIQLRGGGDKSGVGAKVDARWKRWKSFFPLGSDYMNLCDAVCEEQQHLPSDRLELVASSSCAAIVRKVLCMTDAEIEECALQ